jgi:hypothetical protein
MNGEQTKAGNERKDRTNTKNDLDPSEEKESDPSHERLTEPERHIRRSSWDDELDLSEKLKSEEPSDSPIQGHKSNVVLIGKLNDTHEGETEPKRQVRRSSWDDLDLSEQFKLEEPFDSPIKGHKSLDHLHSPCGNVVLVGILDDTFLHQNNEKEQCITAEEEATAKSAFLKGLSGRLAVLSPFKVNTKKAGLKGATRLIPSP